MLRLLWRSFDKHGLGPAGRAHCTWGGHFVTCIPCLAETICFGPPVGRKKDDPDQREGLCRLFCPDRYTSHEVTARTGVPANRSSFAGWPSAVGLCATALGRARLLQGLWSFRSMSLRTILLLLAAVVILAVVPSRILGTTPTEVQALQAAAHGPAFYTLPPEKLKLATELFRMRTTLYFVGSVWGILQIVLLLALGVPAWMRNVVESVTKSRWVQCFLFVFLFLLAIALLDVPLRIYGHHLGLAYGLSVQGWGSWALDWAKSFLISWLVTGLLVMVLFWIIRRSPERWWFWFWIPTMAAVLFGVFLSPVLVDPLFNNFEPLQKAHPALVQQLERVVARSGVSLPPDRMFFMRASQKVTGLNAYVTGFGPSKRLVLWDTTIAQSTPDELSGVFGHELGHYALHHIAFGVLFAAAALLVAFFVGQRMTQGLLQRYGARWGIRSQEDWACLAVLMRVP